MRVKIQDQHFTEEKTQFQRNEFPAAGSSDFKQGILCVIFFGYFFPQSSFPIINLLYLSVNIILQCLPCNKVCIPLKISPFKGTLIHC